MPNLNTPETISKELNRRRVKFETAQREYHELLEEMVQANYTKLFVNTDRELHQDKTSHIQAPSPAEE